MMFFFLICFKIYVYVLIFLGEDCLEDVGFIFVFGNILVNTYVVIEGNKICIVFKGLMKFVIFYVVKFGVSLMQFIISLIFSLFLKIGIVQVIFLVLLVYVNGLVIYFKL